MTAARRRFTNSDMHRAREWVGATDKRPSFGRGGVHHGVSVLRSLDRVDIVLAKVFPAVFYLTTLTSSMMSTILVHPEG